MKPSLIPVTGGGLVLAGALARSCNDALPLALSEFWCGSPTEAFGASAHAHCPGCGLMELGVLMLALSATMVAVRGTRIAQTKVMAR